MILLVYFAKTLICSAVFYAYYLLVLRNRAYHRYNRYYILLATALSAVLPLINIPVGYLSQASSGQLMQTLQAINITGWEQEYVVTANRSLLRSFVSSESIYHVLYVAALCLVSIPLLRSLVLIQRLKKKYKPETIGNIRFYNTIEPGTPFSFFKTIYWNRDIDLKSAEGQQILRHELFHIHQKHSYDLLFMQIMKALFWFNPLHHFMKNELQAIHEFLADQHASAEMDRFDYAELLLMKAIENKRMHLAHQFFNTQIKRRIAMITKKDMNRYNYLGRAMALPLVFIIFCAFSLSIPEGGNPRSGHKLSGADTVPMSELVKIDFASITGFSINTDVAVLTLKDKREITVTKKVFDQYIEQMQAESERQDPQVGREASQEKIYTKMEIEPAFPGGRPAWRRFLAKTFKYPQEAQDKEIQGTVVVLFKVDRQGNVSDVKAISGPVAGGLREEAVRVVKNSGKWLPGIVGGKKVHAYKKQPITFKLEEG